MDEHMLENAAFGLQQHIRERENRDQLQILAFLLASAVVAVAAVGIYVFLAIMNVATQPGAGFIAAVKVIGLAMMILLVIMVLIKVVPPVLEWWWDKNSAHHARSRRKCDRIVEAVKDQRLSLDAAIQLLYDISELYK